MAYKYPDLVLQAHEDGTVEVVGDPPLETLIHRGLYGQIDRSRLSPDGRCVAVAEGVVYELGRYVPAEDSFVMRLVTF